MPQSKTTITTGPADLAVDLRHAIARFSRVLRQQDRNGLGATLTAALASVSRHGSPTHGELASMENVAPPTITAVVGKMESLGFVTRESDQTDRRVTRIRITPLGQAELDRARTRRTEWLQAELEALSADDRALLDAAAAVLTRITEGTP